MKRSTWFLCHFYWNILRTPTLKPQNFVSLIYHDIIWFVLIPFTCLHSSSLIHLVMSAFVLHQLAVFTYVINCFIHHYLCLCPHSLHLMSSQVLVTLAFTELIKALFLAAVNSSSVSLCRFPLRSHIHLMYHEFSCFSEVSN